MDPRVILTRGVNTGLRLGRGTADRVVTIAGPPLGRLTDKVVSKVRRRPERHGPATFTPSKRSDVAESDVAEARARAGAGEQHPVTGRRGSQHRPASAGGEARPAGQAEEWPRGEAATSARQHHLVRPGSAIVGG